MARWSTQESKESLHGTKYVSIWLQNTSHSSSQHLVFRDELRAEAELSLLWQYFRILYICISLKTLQVPFAFVTFLSQQSSSGAVSMRDLFIHQESKKCLWMINKSTTCSTLVVQNLLPSSAVFPTTLHQLFLVYLENTRRYLHFHIILIFFQNPAEGRTYRHLTAVTMVMPLSHLSERT